MNKSIASISLVGAGKGGKALLMDLVKIPGIRIKYVYDVASDAEGMVFARKQKIKTFTGRNLNKILSDPELDLILEVTGKQDVYNYLIKNKLPSVNILSSSASKIIFYFIDAQQHITNELEDYKLTLEHRILERTEEIKRANLELEKKVYEFEKLNEKLQQINDAKTKYLLQATHQLKAPFAAIQSYIEVLLNGYAGNIPEMALSILNKVKVRCDLLSTSIKNMLELANLNSCVIENVKMKTVKLDKIVSVVVESFAAMAGQKKVAIEIKNETKYDSVLGNQEQIKIMVANIIENAIVYSFENTVINVALQDYKNNKVALIIADHGIGIPEENVDKIFLEYFRSNNAVKNHENGTGLGLSIVKRIADIHDAEIEVKSTVGSGTEIKVIFNRLKKGSGR
ncbi:MAG: HAMP domain-containing histidine kinase [Elusimicrobia bacterium]|nr:HAMP domain-containing histidine kinase [Candidatus Liberimonas magnetica]